MRKFKVQLFWEGQKKLRNLPHGCDIYFKKTSKPWGRLRKFFWHSQKNYSQSNYIIVTLKKQSFLLKRLATAPIQCSGKNVISLFKFSIEFHPTKRHHVCQWSLGIGWWYWSSLLFSIARKTARKWPCHFPSMVIGRKLSWVSRGNDAFLLRKKNWSKTLSLTYKIDGI